MDMLFLCSASSAMRALQLHWETEISLTIHLSVQQQKQSLHGDRKQQGKYSKIVETQSKAESTEKHEGLQVQRKQHLKLAHISFNGKKQKNITSAGFFCPPVEKKA